MDVAVLLVGAGDNEASDMVVDARPSKESQRGRDASGAAAVRKKSAYCRKRTAAVSALSPTVPEDKRLRVVKTLSTGGVRGQQRRDERASRRSAPTPPISPDSSAGASPVPPALPAGPAWVTSKRPLREKTPEAVVSIPELHDLWMGMEEREALYHPSAQYIERHPEMRPRMRSLLADWMMEVSEEFGLHRETYHIALNLVDRYLSRATGEAKAILQLIGVSCLFIAAKVEEIYPPRLTKFAELTDGACTDEAILAKELEILQTLDWRLSPMTPVSWLELYLQTDAIARGELDIADLSMSIEYSTPVYSGACKLLDFVTLDYTSVGFSPSVLAASALYLYAGTHLNVLELTGYSEAQLKPCVRYMGIFALLLDQYNQTVTSASGEVEVRGKEAHIIQTHATPYALLDKVHAWHLRTARSAPVTQSASADAAPTGPPPS
eukprot:m.439778 g.439778  ORF g.439778 m.439778 type:complete len:438 (-) comp18417_c0_seq1:244-1557(-)